MELPPFVIQRYKQTNGGIRQEIINNHMLLITNKVEKDYL